MGVLAVRLKSLGYRAVHLPTFGYHLRPLDAHGAILRDRLRALGDVAIDVVTFSYGGVFLRAALDAPDAPVVRRVVMLSPPSHGALMAEQVRNAVPLHRLGWDPLAPLLPGDASRYALPTAEIGVLTGGTGSDVGYNRYLPGDNDGKVRVAEARMDGIAAFKLIPQRHFQMPYSDLAYQETRAFLQTGRFLPADSRAAPEDEPDSRPGVALPPPRSSADEPAQRR